MNDDSNKKEETTEATDVQAGHAESVYVWTDDEIDEIEARR